MANQYNYATHLDIKFNHFERIDIPTLVRECEDNNQTTHCEAVEAGDPMNWSDGRGYVPQTTDFRFGTSKGHDLSCDSER